MLLNGLKSLIVILPFAKFSDHRPCGSSNRATTIFYVTLQDHVIKGSGDFMEGNSSLHIPTPQKIDSHRHCVNGYIIILVYHVILQDYVVIRSCGMGINHSR